MDGSYLAELSSDQVDFDSIQTALGQDFCVWDFALTVNVQNSPQETPVEAVQVLHIATIQRPDLTAILQGGQNE